MNVTVLRIDDRLIHGQIVTKWINQAEATTILVVDDKVAGDKTLQMILKIGVPSGIKLMTLNKKEAVEFLANDASNEKALMLVRNPAETEALFEMGYEIDEINLGNVSNTKSIVGRTKLLDYIYVEEADIEALNKIKQRGIKIIVKAVPEERAKDVFELIAKLIKRK